MKKLILVAVLVAGGCVSAEDHPESFSRGAVPDDAVGAGGASTGAAGAAGAAGSIGTWVTGSSGAAGAAATGSGGAAGMAGDVGGAAGSTSTGAGGADMTGAGGAVAGAGGSGGCGDTTPLLPYGSSCGSDAVCTSHHCTDNGGGMPPFCGCVYGLDCPGTANICDHNTCVTPAGVSAPLRIDNSPTSQTYIYDVQCRNDFDCSALNYPGSGPTFSCIRPGNPYAGLCEITYN